MSANGIIQEGAQNIFEFGDHQHQKEYPKDKVPNEQEPYHEGKAHMHNDLDSKDQRSISNKLEAEENHHHEKPDSKEVQQLKQDPTMPARMHGNKPSRGAEIDKQLQEEDEATVQKMGHQEDFSEKGKHSSEKVQEKGQEKGQEKAHHRLTGHHRETQHHR